MGVQVPSGGPKLKAPFMGAFSFDLPRIRRDLKPTVKKMPLWDTLHKEGVPQAFDNSGFMLFSSDSVDFQPYGVGSLLPNLPV